MKLDARFVKSSVNTLHLPFSSVNSDCVSDNLVWSAHSLNKLMKILSVQTESVPSLTENYAQHLSLDWTFFWNVFALTMCRWRYAIERKMPRNFLNLIHKFASLALVERMGELGRPKFDHSPASDASREVAKSSQTDSRLPILENRTMGVASLLTSTGALCS